jgi:hypothetical protein
MKSVKPGPNQIKSNQMHAKDAFVLDEEVSVLFNRAK